MIHEERLVTEFIELVKVNSESGYEREMADVLKLKFNQLGLRIIEDNSMLKTGHMAGNLVVTLEPTSGYEDVSTIYFTSHMDTVTPGKSIQPIVKDKVIMSDGTTILGSDDKTGIAAMLESIKVIQEEQIHHGKVQFLITVGEETGLKGSSHLQRELFEAEYGYALDSNGPVGDIIVAAPTQARIQVVVHGKSAHAGVNPEDGISAIQVASRAISMMKLGRIDHETTANIGKFQGGTATNIVCDQVEIFAEARSLVDAKMEKQVLQMKKAFEDAANEFSTTIEFQSETMYPSFHFDSKNELVRKARQAILTIGRKPRVLPSGGGSDANILNGYGVPTLNLGIGYENIHTIKERISIEEMVKTVELVVTLIKQIAEEN
ncbi:M20/M25/M40 family metallo-hydrolase [Tepidibacillus marianensis]|uniref:M20/M25/M40 family metallo-hydrolase n=1 Tax=Tepidibacillus marianensis TaxID=3131995 RepID=UPI0030D15C6C